MDVSSSVLLNILFDTRPFLLFSISYFNIVYYLFIGLLNNIDDTDAVVTVDDLGLQFFDMKDLCKYMEKGTPN